jgi:hypothetical protein
MYEIEISQRYNFCVHSEALFDANAVLMHPFGFVHREGIAPCYCGNFSDSSVGRVE